MSTVTVNGTTINLPDNGCWANSESAVALCCSQLGGSRLPVQNNPIPACTGFTVDPTAATDSATFLRWNACIKAHFTTGDVLGTGQTSNCEFGDATSSGTPSSSAPSSSASSSSAPSGSSSASAPTPSNSSPRIAARIDEQFSRTLIAGILLGGSLLHVLSSMI
ncbi:hypothetical protein DFH09DRAFT_1449867 [Mycena vulgaris]|nr:hypothetical protein DFH09DRAFT_1449867 [Mycena vulgaris]